MDKSLQWSNPSECYPRFKNENRALILTEKVFSFKIPLFHFQRAALGITGKGNINHCLQYPRAHFISAAFALELQVYSAGFSNQFF